MTFSTFFLYYLYTLFIETELKIVNGTKEKYSGIEGKVLQAQGLHVAHIAQLYCRIKLQM